VYGPRLLAGSVAYRAVDPLPEQVRVAVVAGVLLDHVDHDPAERELLAVLGPCGIQRRGRRGPLPRVGAFGPPGRERLRRVGAVYVVDAKPTGRR